MAIVLRFYEDLSETQIAALRCRPGTVKSLLSRGLELTTLPLDVSSPGFPDWIP